MNTVKVVAPHEVEIAALEARIAQLEAPALPLSGQVAVVTGSGQGLGWAIARHMARAGAKVVLAEYDSGRGRLAASRLLEEELTARFVQTNVTDPDSVTAMVAEALETWGRVDILVNNAGKWRDKSLRKMPLEVFDDVVELNLRGTFICGQAVAEAMVMQRYGRIINISSIVGRFGNFGQSNYAATKAGVIAMAQTWAKELGPKGVTSNAVAPGYVRTPGTEGDADVQAKLAAVAEQTPVRRTGLPEDVANACLFLALPASGFVNGIVLPVDGGLGVAVPL